MADKSKVSSNTSTDKAEQKRANRVWRREWITRLLLTLLIVLSYVCMGCYRTLPGPTLIYMQEQINSSFNDMPIIFITRSFGYIIGCIVGGFTFDKITSPHARHLLIVVAHVVTGASVGFVLISRSLIALAFVFFAAGLGLSTLDIILSTYLLYIWKTYSHVYFQALRFFYAAGAFIGPCLPRIFMTDFNVTRQDNGEDTVDGIPTDSFPQLLNAYIILGAMIAMVTACWIALSLIQKFTREIVKSLYMDAKVVTKDLFFHHLLTTMVLCFLASCIHTGYHHMLFTFAIAAYGLSSGQSADLVIWFWGNFTLAALCTVSVVQRYHPVNMIAVNLSLELLGAIIVASLWDHFSWLFVGHGLIGAGASSLFTNTLLWYDTHTAVNHRLMAGFLLAESLAEMIIPEVLNAILARKVTGVVYFLLAVPIAYFLVAILQCTWVLVLARKYKASYLLPDQDSTKHGPLPDFLYPAFNLRKGQKKPKITLKSVVSPDGIDATTGLPPLVTQPSVPMLVSGPSDPQADSALPLDSGKKLKRIKKKFKKESDSSSSSSESTYSVSSDSDDAISETESSIALPKSESSPKSSGGQEEESKPESPGDTKSELRRFKKPENERSAIQKL